MYIMLLGSVLLWMHNVFLKTSCSNFLICIRGAFLLLEQSPQYEWNASEWYGVTPTQHTKVRQPS